MDMGNMCNISYMITCKPVTTTHSISHMWNSQGPGQQTACTLKTNCISSLWTPHTASSNKRSKVIGQGPGRRSTETFTCDIVFYGFLGHSYLPDGGSLSCRWLRLAAPSHARWQRRRCQARFHQTHGPETDRCQVGRSLWWSRILFVCSGWSNYGKETNTQTCNVLMPLF